MYGIMLFQLLLKIALIEPVSYFAEHKIKRIAKVGFMNNPINMPLTENFGFISSSFCLS
jgi:hypothetical protein